MINRIKNDVMRFSRERKIRHFYSYFEDGMTVLDAGVSAESTRLLPSANYFVKNFRFNSEYYTGLGVQDLSQMERIYPGKQFVQYQGGVFPFEDNQFDWVFSNAVIEHVGGDSEQLCFLNEMLRVGRKVFFTTPNKYFPIETHTNIPFLHWNNALFYWWCMKTKRYIRKDNLYLFSINRLKRILKLSNAAKFSIHKNRLFGLTMTFTVVCSE